MSQLILDDQLDPEEVLRPIEDWITAQFLRDLRPNEIIRDQRVPAILQTQKQPPFVTIDQDFWHSEWCHAKYCILYFALQDTEQDQIPGLLRALFRRPELKTRAARMGKVARISSVAIDYWEFQVQDLQHIAWQPGGRKKR